MLKLVLWIVSAIVGTWALIKAVKGIYAFVQEHRETIQSWWAHPLGKIAVLVVVALAIYGVFASQSSEDKTGPIRLKFSGQQVLEYRRTVSPQESVPNKQLNFDGAGRLVMLYGDNPGSLMLVEPAGAPTQSESGTNFGVVKNSYTFSPTGENREQTIGFGTRRFRVSLESVRELPSKPAEKAIDYTFNVTEQ